MKTTAPELDRVIQNILLYVNEKSVRVTHVFFTVLEDTLSAYSTDDYIAITDSLRPEEIDWWGFTEFPIDDIKKLGEWIKKDKKVIHKSEISIKFKHTLVNFSSQDSDEDLSISFAKESQEDALRFIFELLAEDADSIPTYNWAIKPERLAKLARIKADKEAPLDLRGVDIRGHLLVQFKRGDTVIGCINPVDRSKVHDRFLWD